MELQRNYTSKKNQKLGRTDPGEQLTDYTLQREDASTNILCARPQEKHIIQEKQGNPDKRRTQMKRIPSNSVKLDV